MGDEAARVEGRAEQLFARLLDIDPEVKSYEPQGLGADLVKETLLYTKEQRDQAKLRYVDDPATSYYTADFDAQLISSKRRVYEVKDERYPEDRESENRYQRARPIFLAHGVDVCKVVLPCESEPIWANVSLVHKMTRRRDLHEQFKDAATALEGVQVKVAGDVLEAIGATTNHLPLLIAMGVLAVDLFDGHIRAGMRATQAYGSLDHLRVIERLVR